MGSIAGHRKRIEEHLEEIEDAVSIGIEKRPATIGFHTVACAVEMLELYLHKKSLIDMGKLIKHDWFKTPVEGQKILPLIERKLAVSFDGKEAVYKLLYVLEENRDSLIYGKATKEQVELVLLTFQKLKDTLSRKLEEEGEKLE